MKFPLSLLTKLSTVALAAIVCVTFASCADDTISNSTDGVKTQSTQSVKLATSTMLFSANVGLQLPDITNTIDPNTPATRAVSLNERYMPLAEGSDLKARVFVVKADKNAMKMINGKQAMDPDKVVMGAGEVTWDNIQQVNGGGVNLHSNKNALTLTWLGKEVPMKAGEDWYICGIIGGEYDNSFKETSETTTDPALKKLALQLYNFYVKFNPSSAHNTRDAKGNLRVTAAFSTGWTKLNIKQTNVIDIRNWIFKARGTLLRFKVKRDTELVKPEAHKYSFASSQLTANGGFLMMPLSSFRGADAYKTDCEKGLDCEIRPWEQDIDHNFYWQYQSDQHKTFNDIEPSEPSKSQNTYYEYRYTYDAGKMHEDKYGKDYDEFYVWGMPMPMPGYNGTTQLTAERGSFMLGRKQPANSKYDYADEWLLAKGEVSKELNTNEYKIIDFTSEQNRNKAFSAELGVCRPRFSEMENGKFKYAWANPLEGLAVTNSKTNEKGWHDSNKQNSTDKNSGYIDNLTCKSGDFKMRFLINGKTKLPDNYHVPNNEEWGCAIPNIYTNLNDRWLDNGLLGWDRLTPGATPWFEMYNPGKDDDRSIITAGETHNNAKREIQEERDWGKYPAFYSYYMQDRDKSELMAIRFNGTNPQAKYTGEKYLIGNRYRCAYRWRFINCGNNEDSNDEHGMRLVVQSRWIGNANVSLMDLKDDKWWGESSSQNPLFNTDCYRVMSCTGYPYTGHGWTWYISFWTSARWKFVPNTGDDQYINKSMCYRRFSKDGFERGHNDGSGWCLPVRLIINRNVDEFGSEAPRKKQHDRDQNTLISRKADGTVSDWTYTPPKGY